jgi:hypothetical protein
MGLIAWQNGFVLGWVTFYGLNVDFPQNSNVKAKIFKVTVLGVLVVVGLRSQGWSPQDGISSAFVRREPPLCSARRWPSEKLTLGPHQTLKPHKCPALELPDSRTVNVCFLSFSKLLNLWYSKAAQTKMSRQSDPRFGPSRTKNATGNPATNTSGSDLAGQ